VFVEKGEREWDDRQIEREWDKVRRKRWQSERQRKRERDDKKHIKREGYGRSRSERERDKRDGWHRERWVVDKEREREGERERCNSVLAYPNNVRTVIESPTSQQINFGPFDLPSKHQVMLAL
jgi:hypothetical protein